MTTEKKHIVLVVAFIIVQVLAVGCKNYNSDYSTNPYPNTPMQDTPPANQVYMQNDAFNPKSLTITKGTTVKWTNKDSINHTVTSGSPGSPSGLFNSGNLSGGATFSYKFDTPGTYNYYCSVHQDIMVGIIVVN